MTEAARGLSLRSERAGSVASYMEVSEMEDVKVMYDASRGVVMVSVGESEFEMPLSVANLVASKIDGIAAAGRELRLLSR